MTEYEITKQRVVEIVTRIPVEIKLIKNIETGKIVGKLIIDSSDFGEFNLDESDMACLPNSAQWKAFFEHKFDKFDMTNVIKEG